MSLAIKKADKSTMWINLITFNEGLIKKVIEPYVLKGSKIAIQGELNIRNYKTKDDVEKVSVEVLINDLTLLGSSRKNNDE